MRTKKLYRLGPQSFEVKKVHELGKDGKSVAQFDHIVSDRVGHSWAAGRLKPGDILLCDELTGDCFYSWYLVDFTDLENAKDVCMRLVPYPFGAYSMDATQLAGLTEREYHLLRAGEQVEVEVMIPHN